MAAIISILTGSPSQFHDPQYRIIWELFWEKVAFVPPFVFGFGDDSVEVRNVYTGALVQILKMESKNPLSFESHRGTGRTGRILSEMGWWRRGRGPQAEPVGSVRAGREQYNRTTYTPFISRFT